MESIENIYIAIEGEKNKLNSIKSIHVQKINELEEEIRSYARIFEDISLAARLIIEHILEMKSKKGLIAIEAESISQNYSSIRGLELEEFGLIKVSLGDLVLTWRDQDNNYLFYPDKVELRSIDEKKSIKIFFSLEFGTQVLGKFPVLADQPNIMYFHPSLIKNI